MPKVVDLPRCNNADSDWYVRMPADPPPVDPKVETLPQVYQEKAATLEPALPVKDSFQTEMGGYVSWKKINNRNVSQIQNTAGQSGKKSRCCSLGII